MYRSESFSSYHWEILDASPNALTLAYTTSFSTLPLSAGFHRLHQIIDNDNP
jgi:hypothetical protein